MNTNITIEKHSRIPLDRLIRIIKDDSMQSEFILNPSKTRMLWVTDQDLYSAFMVLANNKEIIRSIAKIIENIMIIPAHAAGQERKPLSPEEYEKLMNMVI
jgi:hypothetical protein